MGYTATMSITRPIAVSLIFLMASGTAPLVADRADLDRQLKKIQPGDHPRLLVEKDTFPKLSETYRKDSRTRELVQKLEASAKAVMEKDPIRYKKTGRRLLSVSREALKRILLLAALDRITGNDAYGARALEEMKAARDMADWNPSHFLDTAEMTLALSIGYDWLYEKISEEDRRSFREAILSKGLEPSLSRDWWWIDAENNWNQVCHSGMVAGALAVAGHSPDLALNIIDRAVKNLPHAMKASYAPNGSYPEGVGYWNYGTAYNVLLIDMLRTALGDDFGLMHQPGFSATGDYYHSAHTPSGRQFSYADARSSDARGHLSPAMLWLARAFDRPDWVSSQIAWFGGDFSRLMGSAYAPFYLLWGLDIDRDAPVRVPLDWEGKGEKPVAMHRSGWGLKDVYAGICAGSPSSNHGHMDIGSFVFESDGVSWVCDLGLQSYHSLESRGIGLWDKSQEGQRWDIFRLGPFSHNTITINGQKQQVKSFASISSFSDHPTHPASVIDMSATYQGQAAQVLRGIRLFNRSHLIIRDRIGSLVEDSEIRWAMTTGTEIKIDHPRRAILTSGDQTLVAHLIEPAEAHWEMIDISEGPQLWDEANPGMKQLIFKHRAKTDSTANLTIILETGRPGAPTPEDATGWNLPSPGPR